MVTAVHLSTDNPFAPLFVPKVVPPPKVTKLGRAAYEAMSDVELLGHVTDGSELAWQTFFRRFRGLIMSCALKAGLHAGLHLGADDLKDVLGDVSLNMVAHGFRRLRLYRLDGGCSVATWIGVIATSTARDYLRRARRHRLEPTADAELDRLASPTVGPEEVLIDRQRRAFVDRAFQQLSTRDQEFVELYFGDAENPEDIAKRMGVSVATVYSKKAKIKTRLLGLVMEGHA
jgi:RNA polymerase sigma-70 factor (ECF subfamily)